jgi:hypothetical protein
MLWLLVTLAVCVVVAYLLGHRHGLTKQINPIPLPPELEREEAQVECILMDPLQQAVISRRVLPAHLRPSKFTRYHGRRVDTYEEVRRDGDRYVYRLTKRDNADGQ